MRCRRSGGRGGRGEREGDVVGGRGMGYGVWGMGYGVVSGETRRRVEGREIRSMREGEGLRVEGEGVWGMRRVESEAGYE